LTLAPIEPGDVRVLVWAGRDLVGGLEDLAIEAGEARRVRLRLGPGLLLPLTELPWRPTFYTEDRMIVLRTRDGATLPVLHFGSRLPTSSLFFPPFFTKHEHRDERPSRPHSRTVGVETVSVPHDAVLGPYPVDLVEVRETSGRAYRSHVFEGD